MPPCRPSLLNRAQETIAESPTHQNSDLLPVDTHRQRPRPLRTCAQPVATLPLAAGLPVGDPAYCRSTIESLFTAIAEKINAIRTLSHVLAGRTAKPQDIYRVLRSCIASASIGYLIRTTPPGLITRQAALFDDATFRCITKTVESVPGPASHGRPGGVDGRRRCLSNCLHYLT